MKKKYKILFILIAIFLILFGFKKYIPNSSIVGDYVNVNYGIRWLADVPSSKDTLILFENNTFKSNYWGEGTYKLKWNFRGTKLEILYNHGRAISRFNVKREWFFGKPKLIVSSDLNYHYEKFK